MSTPEGEVRNAVMAWLKLHRIMCWIYDSVGIYDPTRKCFRIRHGKHRMVGLPDVHGILPSGRFLGIEVKAPGRYLRPEQKERIAEINASGGLAFMARSLKDLEERKSEMGIASGL